MFAIVETGGKQYRVSPGQTVEVEKLPALPGDTVELGQVLLISTDDNQTMIGTPALDDAKIVARVTQAKRGPKIVVFRYKSKARYRRKTGHRQDYTAITIEDIWANGASLLPAKEEAEVPADTEDETAEVAIAEVKTAEVEEAAPETPKRRSKKGTTSSEAETETASAEGETVTTTTQKTTRTVKRTRVEVVEEDGEVTEVIEGEPEVVSEVTEEKKSTRRSRKGE